MVSGRIFHAEHFPSIWADKGLHGNFQRADIFDALVECVQIRFLCGEAKRVLFHRRQDAQITLDTSRVVIANILLDHLNKLVLADEPSAVIAFPFQDAPEALHRAVINAMRHAGHTLRHSGLHELVVESTVGVLEPSVAVEQRMRVRIGLHSLVKSLENQQIIVAFTQHIGHDAPVAKV